MTDNEIEKYFLSLYKKLLDVKYDLKITQKEFLALNRVHSLIIRQKAEIEKLQTVKKHIDTLIHRGVEYPTAKTYEQAFKKALEQLYDNTNAEEKLQQILPMLDELNGDIKHDINLAKAEAYKEFAYELQQIPRKTVFKSEIRSLLKEKVGGDV